jgi:hypothetical protein
MPASAAALPISPGDKAVLARWANAAQAPAALVRRAKILLLAAEGVANSEIADQERCGAALRWALQTTSNQTTKPGNRPHQPHAKRHQRSSGKCRWSLAGCPSFSWQPVQHGQARWSTRDPLGAGTERVRVPPPGVGIHRARAHRRRHRLPPSRPPRHHRALGVEERGRLHHECARCGPAYRCPAPGVASVPLCCLRPWPAPACPGERRWGTHDQQAHCPACRCPTTGHAVPGWARGGGASPSLSGPPTA